MPIDSRQDRIACIRGVGDTAFGRLADATTLTLMAEAAESALADAGLERGDVDGLLCGYSTALPHIMLASVFAEYFGLHPRYSHAVSAGGATGGIMAMLAAQLVNDKTCRNILVVGGENRLSHKPEEPNAAPPVAIGHPDYEAPFGVTTPAYYGLMASRYMSQYGITEADLAEFAVLMRRYAGTNPKAHMRKPITTSDVLASRPIASPLKLLDCCLVSDGGCAVIVGGRPATGPAVRIGGAAQHHPHQHIVHAPSLTDFGARRTLDEALAHAGVTLDDMTIAGIYDSYTITLLAFIEDLELAPRGGAAKACREGAFGPDGKMPVNTHGGLMSFGHSGVGGGLAHIAEVYRQLAGKAGERQLGERKAGFIYGEGGLLSSQICLVLLRE